MTVSRAAFAAVIACATFAVYFGALDAAFQFDDFAVIAGNPDVHSWQAWSASMPGIRPLLKASYVWNWSDAAHPFAFHLFNAVVHALNAALVFCLVEELLSCGMAPDARRAALIAALLFAVHPVNTESVTYISGRSNALMAFFYLSSLLVYMRGRLSGSPAWSRWISALLFVAAAGVKETALTLPVALLLWECTLAPQRLTLKEAFGKTSLHWFALFGLLLAMLSLPRYGELLHASLAARSPLDNLPVQANAICYLLGQLVLPWRVNIDPDLPVLREWHALALVQASGLCIAIVAALRMKRRTPLMSFAVLWFFVHLLPTNSLLPRLDAANDRELYLPAIGAFLLCGVWLARLRRRGVAHAVALIIVAGLAFATVARNRDYLGETALWEDTVAKSPRKARAWNNLGQAYALDGRKEEAKRAFDTALALQPDYDKAQANRRMAGEEDDGSS